MEKWDAYLKDGSQTGQFLERGKAIPKGLYHIVVEVIVIHEDKSILFTKRHPDKASYPSHFEASAGGSALAGESSLEGIQRELHEETGLWLSQESFELNHQFCNEEHACLFDVFIARTTLDKNTVKLQDTETTDFIWVRLEDLNDFLARNLIIPRHKAFLSSATFQEYIR